MPKGATITFRTVDGSVRPVTAYWGEDAPHFTAGFGGWDVVTRPRRTSGTQWNGKDPLQMEIPILFDGWISGEPVEDDIMRLTHMAWPPKEGEEPPKIKVGGGTPGDTFTWVINDLQFGTNVIRDFDRGSLVRYRQDCTVVLLQHIDVDLAPASRPNVGSVGHPRYYVVKSGDTLPKISLKMYGTRNKWKQIAKANHIRDPKDIKVGQRLRIP